MPSDLILASVVPHAVVEHQLHVINKFLNVMIDVEGQFLLDCAEVHGLVDDVEIVIDAVLARVHRFVKEVSAF